MQTGMRKKEDYLSHNKLSQIIGRGNKALSRSLAKCCRKGWIEVRNIHGKILTMASERSGQKLFYRLGPIILSVTPTGTPVDNFKGPVSKGHRFLNDLSKQPVDNFSDLCQKDTGINNICQDQCQKDTGLGVSLNVRARVSSNIKYINDIDSEKRNFKNVDDLSIESQEFEKMVDKCRYLCEKMNDNKYLGLYIKIAKQIGVDLLERAIGLAKEDPNIKNKGAYMVKICKTYGYTAGKPPAKNT